MATKVVDVQIEINKCLEIKENFLLSGGAGSGKTHTLVETLKSVFAKNQNAKVACITYTNVAADEIKSRAPFDNLRVSTIHDFLWSEIKNYQKNLCDAFRELNEISSETEDYQIDNLQYLNYRDIKNGIISHDDVIKISSKVFENCPKLARILCDRYEYIFIDEYQDTAPSVIKIFLEDIDEFSQGKLCIGMFGDRMQAIYNTGVDAKDDGMKRFKRKYREIVKSDNYRCSSEVIELLNKIRDDNLTQKTSGKNLVGSSMFIYSNQEFNLDVLKGSSVFKNWKFDDSKNTKILMLTHNLSAIGSNFSQIREIYNSCDKLKSFVNDRLFGSEPDKFAALLLKIGNLMDAFKKQDYKTLISGLDRSIKNNEDKREIAKIFREFSENSNTTIGEVILRFEESKILRSTEILTEYRNEEIYGDFWERISEVPLVKVSNYYDYYSGYLPFSTQHGVKGAEYENVLVNLDNGNWRLYNFEKLFLGNTNAFTKKLFYVSCSRAKDNLAVYMQTANASIIRKAKELFGEKNCFCLDDLVNPNTSRNC